MARVLVLYYSAYGHIETLATAVAEGARSAGSEVDIKRVPELVSYESASKAGFKLDQPAPLASIADLEHYDAIVIGTGTRFGRMSSQMANFLDQAGSLWARGALNGKVGGAFTSTGTQHGGQAWMASTPGPCVNPRNPHSPTPALRAFWGGRQG